MVKKVEYKVSTIFVALMVRAFLIGHNVLATWRVVETRGNSAFWGLAAGNIFTLAEAVMVVKNNGGNEWKWWCPVFLSYLVTTLPAVWLLQLSQYDKAVASQDSAVTSAGALGPQSMGLIQDPSNPQTNSSNLTLTSATTPIINVTTDSGDPMPTSFTGLLALQEDTWIVVIQESLMYLLVFGRWMLPRGDVSRDALADLLLEYLAMASDIMELYAIFDEDTVLSNFGLTYAILTLWSISFFQFVPVLVRKNKYREIQSDRMKKISRACGTYFAEVVVTCLSVFLQDGPFLCLRLYIIIVLNLTTYSLVFFVLKNIVTLLLLFYRLTILCIRLPCCYEEEFDVVAVDEVDFDRPIAEDKAIPNIFRTSTAYSDLDPRKFTFGSLNSYY